MGPLLSSTNDETAAIVSGEESSRIAFYLEAARIRDEAWGNTLTYSPKVFIPLTRYCRDSCGYCTFVRQPGEDGSGYMTLDEVLSVAEAGRRAGCLEALFSLGDKPELRYKEAAEDLKRLGYTKTTDYLFDCARAVYEQTGLLPHINCGVMGRDDLQKLRSVSASMGLMLESVSTRLLKLGQAHHGCPDKVPKVRIETLREAGKLNIPFTTGILIGIGETVTERIQSLETIRNIHLEFGHIQEVIIQNFRRKPDIPMANHPEPDHNDMMMTIALARRILPCEVSIQAPPNLSSRYPDYIDAGLNDWGGISPVTRDHINPERAWPLIESLRKECAKKGFTLSKRLTVYPRFIEMASRYLDTAIQPWVTRHLSEGDLD